MNECIIRWQKSNGTYAYYLSPGGGVTEKIKEAHIYKLKDAKKLVTSANRHSCTILIRKPKNK